MLSGLVAVISSRFTVEGISNTIQSVLSNGDKIPTHGAGNRHHDWKIGNKML